MQTALAPTDPPYLAGLNAPQRQAVLTTEGPVLILAGAGTGKTRALTTRLAHILHSRLAWPSEVLCVTFTNKAAREMQHRMAQLLGGAVEGMPYLGTFHAVAARMLRRHASLVGLGSNFTILDTDDQQRLMKQVLIEAGIDEKRWAAKALAGHIDRFKNRGWTPAQVPAGEAREFADGKVVPLYARYQARLIELNAADFGDLLLHMLTIFLAHADVLGEYQRRFKYVLVDEYQDTNVAQYLWLRLLAQARRNIACVGDDDQSIYSWRGAEVANILRFEADFPGATIVRLEQNYRSTPSILAAAGGLIARNSGRLGKTLWTDMPPGESVRVIGVWDGPEEARLVGERIETLQRGGVSLNDIAILVRAQFQTREFEDRFITIGLPYKIVGGFRFYERAEIRDALAYLRVVVSPNDSLAFERIVNTPKRGLGDKAMQRLHALARSSGRPLSVAANAIIETDELTGAARRALAGLMQDIARWRGQVDQLTHPELARIILEESGYLAMWQADKSPEAAGRVDNLIELTRAMEEFDSLAAFMEHVALVMENEASDVAEKVTIMTLHGAKGLEFDHVLLVGWEEGVFPSQRALDEGGNASLEEERRLAYVGITRARKTATILHAANRRVYGQWTSSIPSRFIAELPEDAIQVTNTMSGGPSLWRAALGASDPFADVGRGTGRGPGWQRASGSSGAPPGALGGRGRLPAPIEARASAVSFAQPGRGDVAVGARVFHTKFGYGAVTAIDGNKLEIDFEKAGSKRVLDSFIEVAG
jgi:DNA helicase-2/ATP-dependent DNA helicase PcrA